MVNAPEPERKRKPKEPAVDAAKLAKKLQGVAEDDGKENKPGKSKPGAKKKLLVKKSEMVVVPDMVDDMDDDMDDVPIGQAFALPAPKPKPPAKDLGKKMTEKTVKERKVAEKGKPGRKATAMGKAANIAAAGLKRPAKQFEVDEEPSSRGSKKVPAGGRPAKRRARAALEDRFAAVKTPKALRSPNVLDDTDVIGTRWPSMDLAGMGDMSPLFANDFKQVGAKGKSKKGGAGGAPAPRHRRAHRTPTSRAPRQVLTRNHTCASTTPNARRRRNHHPC